MKPRVHDWIFNPEYRDDDENSVLKQPISKIDSTNVQTLSFDLKHPFNKSTFPIADLKWNSTLKGWEVKPGASNNKAKWQGRFNWYGDMHVFDLEAISKDQAFVFMCVKLAKELERSSSSIVSYFRQHPANFSITEIEYAQVR